MTSPRYSNDKADSKDLLRSFIKVLPFSVIALLVLSLQHLAEVVQLVTSQEFRMQKQTTQIISYFGNEGFLYPALILYGMVICGIIMSVMLFRFMLTKKSVNVYFSLGITRSRLYINRILAGVLALLLAVTVPLGIVLILNLANFGASAHVFEVFLYEVSVLFISGFAGFSIATVCSTFSGSLVEMILNTVAVSVIPSIISTIALHIKDAFLPGYVGSYRGASYIVDVIKGRAFSPWYLAVDLDIVNISNGAANNSSVYLGNPYSDMAQQISKTVPENHVLDRGLMLPVLIWVIIGAVLLALGYVLINKRKAENSNSFGKFYISAAVLGTTAFLITAMIAVMICEEIYNNPSFKSPGDNPFFRNAALLVILFIVIALIVFFVVELVVRRKLKEVFKTWPVFAVLVLVSIIAVAYFASGKFGTYNKLPAASEIDSVALDIYDPVQLFPTHLITGDPLMSNNADDIKLVTEQFAKIRDSKGVDGRDSSAVAFKIKLKNGETILRRFVVYDAAVFEEYVRAAYGSDYYKQNMKNLLLGKDEKHLKYMEDDMGDLYYEDAFGARVYVNVNEINSGRLSEQLWYFASDNYLIDGFYTETVTPDGGGIDTDENGVPFDFDDNEALMNALYNDLSKRSFDQMYFNAKRPVGVLFSNPASADYADNKYILTNEYGDSYYLMEDSYYTPDGGKYDASKIRASSAACPSNFSFIYIYEDMTETVELLKAHGLYADTHEAKIKEVYYTDSKLSANDALTQVQIELAKNDKNYYYWGADGYIPERNFETGTFCSAYGTDIAYSDYYGYIFRNEQQKTFTLFELINILYDRSGHSLKKATPEKAQEIVDGSVPFYCNYKDDGRYVYVIYEDNVITCQYVPEANVAVLN